MKVVLSEEEVKQAAIESLRKRFQYSVDVKFYDHEHCDRSSSGMIFEVSNKTECEVVEREILTRREANWP